MSALHRILRAFDRALPAPVARAHCDIPCGIYDPHLAQVAAHTVIRMNMLISDLPKPFPGDSAVQVQDYTHKLARYTATKEQHAEIAKHEVRVLWADYFKPEHLKQFPQLHEIVFKTLKAASKARQEVNLAAAEDLLKDVNEIAEIFWKTKGKDVVRAKAAYPTEREIVLPKLA